MYGAGEVRIENVPDPRIEEPTDAIIRVVRASICGSDLWPYNDLPTSETGSSRWVMRRSESSRTPAPRKSRGDRARRIFADAARVLGRHLRRREGLHNARVHGGFFDGYGLSAAQAEAVRVLYADGTLYPLPAGEDDVLLPSLLTLSDASGPAITRRHRQGRTATGSRSSATGRSGCAGSSRRSGSVPSRSSSWAGTPIGSRLPASSAPPTSSASAARKRSSA